MSPNPVPIPDTSAFDKAVDWTIRMEGGDRLHRNANDPGGLTKFGISARAHPNVNVRDLTRDQAKTIYHNHYWLHIHGDQLPSPLAFVVFDTAVNCGVYAATRMLQEVLGVKVDGKFGPKTLAAARAMSLDRLYEFIAVRDKTYEALVWEKKPPLRVFRDGWRNRALALLQEATKWRCL